MSVAESIEILPPMSQVGCASASSTVTSASSARVRPRNGPPEAVSDELVDRARPLAGEQLVQRGMLGVDGQDLRAGRLRERHHELAADDERLLVGEREVDPLPERGDGRAEAGGADERVEHEVGARLEHEPHEPLGAAQHLAVGPGLGGARARVGIGQRDAIDAEEPRLLDQGLRRALRAQADELELGIARDDVERLGADRAGRAEDEEAAGHVRRHSRRRWCASFGGGALRFASCASGDRVVERHR